MIIYKATNKENGKIYIGQTTQTLSVRNRHRKYGSTKFDLAYKKYGEDGFTWEIIDSATNINCLNKKESFWIEFYHSTVDCVGYNLQGGGDNAYKTDEVKKKIGEAQVGEKNHMFGKKHGLNGRSKRIINLETGDIYESGTHAIESLNLTSDYYIYNSCNGKCSSIYGQRFRYLDDKGEFIPTRFDSDTYEKLDVSVWCLNDEKYFSSYDECSEFYGVDKKKILKQCYNINKNKETINFKNLMNKGFVFVRNSDYEDVYKLKDKVIKSRNYTGSEKEVICIDDGRVFKSITDVVIFYNALYEIQGLSKSTLSNHLNKGAKFRFFNLTFKYLDEIDEIKDNTSKIIGVCKDRNKFKAYGKRDKSQTTLGTFNTYEEALICRLKFEKEMFGEFAPQKHLFEKYNI